MAIEHAVLGTVGVFMIVAPHAFDLDRDASRVFGCALFSVAAAVCAAFGIGAVLPQRRWAWVCGLLLIAFGMTGCCLPVCIPLLIAWIKPSTREWFGYS
jgi:drug/metabolite transporter (DMT)-like permease